MNTKLFEENRTYWLNRAQGYSEVNKEELSGVQRRNWASFLNSEIEGRFPGRSHSEISIIDIGAGPGFISIILAELGFKVTAFDFAETMLKEARENAGDLAESISFVQGNAMDLTFEDGTFDVVISRNLTWNLEDPKLAYSQWTRVLKPGGLMLVFDANWYGYLWDDKKKADYLSDRENVAKEGLGDYNIGDNFDRMEEIAGKMPLTTEHRPDWDIEYLQSLKVGTVSATEDVGQVLYSKKEKINYKSTPLFMVKLAKD
jgi:ubiquinone/menaquinone biosynthesis C-methylase UbiE